MKPLAVALLTGLCLMQPALALDLNGLWLGNDGQNYQIRQNSKQVQINSPRDRLQGRLSEDEYFVQLDRAVLQWVDDDTLVITTGSLGRLTRLRRQ